MNRWRKPRREETNEMKYKNNKIQNFKCVSPYKLHQHWKHKFLLILEIVDEKKKIIKFLSKPPTWLWFPLLYYNLINNEFEKLKCSKFLIIFFEESQHNFWYKPNVFGNNVQMYGPFRKKIVVLCRTVNHKKVCVSNTVNMPSRVVAVVLKWTEG